MKSVSQTRRNLFHCTTEGLFATPWTMISLPGSFLMAGLLNVGFNVGPFWFGLIASMPLAANALQIVAVPVMSRFMRVRDLTLCTGWLNIGAWLAALLGLSFLPQNEPALSGPFFIALFMLVSLSASLGGVGWTSWVSEFVPGRIRGRFLGFRNRWINLTTLAFMGFTLVVLELLDASRLAYMILIGLAVVLRIISILILHLIVSPDPSGGSLVSANWMKDLMGLRKVSSFVRFVLFGSAAGFLMSFLGTIAPLYSMNELGATPADYTGFSIAAAIAGAIGVRLWGQIIDRHGALPSLMISFVGWRLGDFAWILISPSTLNWMYLIWTIGGFQAAGFILSSFNLLLKLIPSDKRTAGISLNLTITSVAAFIAPITAGYLISLAELKGLDMVNTFRLMFACALTLSILSVGLLIGMKEPKVNPAYNTVHGAMRTLRHLTVNQGLAFLSNANFIYRKRKG